MGVGSVSFYQQDQSYWSQSQAQSSASSAQASLINVIGTAMTDLSKGKASIANNIALKRVNSQLTAAVQSILQGTSPTSSSSSTSTGSNSSSSSKAATGPSPATGTGTVPLTTGTSLSSLGILAGGQINISAGANLTTYTSTGTDTVGDLMNAINIDLPTNAQVTASLNNKGDLVFTSRNTTETFVVGGIYAANIGFGAKNSTFNPVKGTPGTSTASTATSSSSSSSTSKSASSTSSSSKTTSKSKSTKSVSSVAQEGSSSAASLLSASGVSGSLVDMLA
jgi:hypothetical protein